MDGRWRRPNAKIVVIEDHRQRERSLSEITTVRQTCPGAVFPVRRVKATGSTADFRERLSRSQMLVSLASLRGCRASVFEAMVVNSQAGQPSHGQVGYDARRWGLIPIGFEPIEFRPSYEALYDDIAVRNAARRTGRMSASTSSENCPAISGR